MITIMEMSMEMSMKRKKKQVEAEVEAEPLVEVEPPAVVEVAEEVVVEVEAEMTTLVVNALTKDTIRKAMIVIMGIVLLHIPEAKTRVNFGAMLKKAMNPVVKTKQPDTRIHIVSIMTCAILITLMVKKTMREVQELFLHQREKEEERRTRTREGGKIQDHCKGYNLKTD